MKKTILKAALITGAVATLFANSAWATPVNVTGGNGEETLTQILANNGWTIDPNSDQILTDQYWQPTVAPTVNSTTLLIEVAGQKDNNYFGIFDKISGDEVNLMPGSAGSVDSAALKFSATGLLSATYYEGSDQFVIDLTGKNIGLSYGFYIANDFINFKWYSDESKNTDLADHMVSYAGTGSNGLPVNYYVIAFEDTNSSEWDFDYNDMVLQVESMNPAPVPEPTTMLLFGAGLIGLAGMARRKKMKN